MDRICYIFGAGEQLAQPPSPDAGDLVIAADGGYLFAASLGLRVDLLVGDFDSLGGAPPLGIDTLALPSEKDHTDMRHALDAGWELGYRRFHIYGGTGGRLDHTLANIQCAAYIAEKGGAVHLFDRDAIVTAIHNAELRFPAHAAGTLSVFAHSNAATGVDESGLKYVLADATLNNRDSIGVSNEFIGDEATVRVRDGILIVIYPIDLAGRTALHR